MNSFFYREGDGGIYLRVKVVPNSTKETLSYEKFRKQLKIKVSSPPEKGKANERLLELVSEKFDSDACIVKGLTSREKTLFLIPNGSTEELIGKIEEFS